MKLKRYRKAAKIMDFYEKNFGFYKPYNLLIDGTFCSESLKHQVKIKEQLPSYLNSEVNIVTTPCCIIELENLTQISAALKGAWLILKQFGTHSCGHEGNPIASSACVKSMIGDSNRHRYSIASQDKKLQNDVREQWIGVPVLYMHGAAPTILKPTHKCLQYVNQEAQTLIPAAEQVKLDAMKVALGIEKKRKVRDSSKPRKRLTGAEVRRRKREKGERRAEKIRAREMSIQKEVEKLKAAKLHFQQPPKKKKKKAPELDIHKQISMVLGV